MKPSLLFTCFTLCATVSSAQWAGASAATVAYVEGDVYVDAQQVQQPDFPIKPGSVVRTEKGRAEVHFGRNDAIFLGANSSIRISDNAGISPAGLEILSGSAVVISGEIGPAVSCRGLVHLSDAGVFRFDRHQVVDENFCKVRVYKGAAGAPMLSFVWVLTPGKTVDLGSCGDFTPRDEFNIDDADDLTRWSRERAGVRP